MSDEWLSDELYGGDETYRPEDEADDFWEPADDDYSYGFPYCDKCDWFHDPYDGHLPEG